MCFSIGLELDLDAVVAISMTLDYNPDADVLVRWNKSMKRGKIRLYRYDPIGDC